MKSNELRMGNLLRKKKTPQLIIMVKGILPGPSFFGGHPEHDHDDHDPFYEDCEGVPLTEERLVKFGFVKSQVLNDDRMYLQIQDKFLAIDSKGYCFYGADTKYIQLPIIIKTCHVLQNFMYSFAGVELTIKEGVNK